MPMTRFYSFMVPIELLPKFKDASSPSLSSLGSRLTFMKVLFMGWVIISPWLLSWLMSSVAKSGFFLCVPSGSLLVGDPYVMLIGTTWWMCFDPNSLSGRQDIF